MRWLAYTDATLNFSRGTVTLRYVFQALDGTWRLHGFRLLTE